MRTCLRLAIPLLAALSLGACASAPKPIRGEFSTLSPEQASQQGTPGATVRWGGSLIAVEPEASRTCFTVLSRPLRSDGKPQLKREVTDGRFIACRSGFYDPALFAEGRDVTFTGQIGGFERRAIGSYEFNYPRLDADVVYLWEEREERIDPRHAYPYRSPFWGPWWRPFW
jgi:outer membrane lipoprotein